MNYYRTLRQNFETRSIRGILASHVRTYPQLTRDNAQPKFRENRSVTSKAVIEAHTHTHTQPPWTLLGFTHSPFRKGIVKAKLFLRLIQDIWGGGGIQCHTVQGGEWWASSSFRFILGV